MIAGALCAFSLGIVLISRITNADVYRLARVVLALLYAAVLPVVLLLFRAESLGQEAARGASVKPVQILGIVVLDVSNPSVRVLWSDPKTPHPPYFGGSATAEPAAGTLLGQTDSAIVVNLKFHDTLRIVRFDARQVIVEFEETPT
jgi:hypothetical protein